jgi:dihydroorotate dehydrogenase
MTLSPDRIFLISPPFGSYFRSRRAYSVLGSYTRLARPGRTMQVLRTVRPLGREPDGESKGWVNKIGLRNGGELAMAVTRRKYKSWQIISLALVDGDEREWQWVALRLRPEDRAGAWPVIYEINVSYPNTEHPSPALSNRDDLLRGLCSMKLVDVVWKLPPVASSVDAALRLADLGARYLHLSNTLPSPIGGLSGKSLREANLPLIERTCTSLDHNGFSRKVEIIAGGGIYRPEHIRAYRDAGATRFSLATAFMNPARGYHLLKELT